MAGIVKKLIIGATVLVILLPLLVAARDDAYWVPDGTSRDSRILIYLPELDEPLAVDGPIRIGVAERTEQVSTRLDSRQVAPGVVMDTYKVENVKVERASFTGSRDYRVARGDKIYMVHLSWADGKYSVAVDGKKINRKFFSQY